VSIKAGLLTIITCSKQRNGTLRQIKGLAQTESTSVWNSRHSQKFSWHSCLWFLATFDRLSSYLAINLSTESGVNCSQNTLKVAIIKDIKCISEILLKVIFTIKPSHWKILYFEKEAFSRNWKLWKCVFYSLTSRYLGRGTRNFTCKGD